MNKEQLNAKIAELRGQVDKIERAEDAKECAKLNGKCFRYLNSYGSGDKWWLYAKVVGVNGDHLRVISFQMCSDRRAELEYKAYFSPSLAKSYEEITKAEFNKAARKFAKHIADNIAKVLS